MKKYGFSLIEIMMVALVIGILAGIATPRYIRLVEKGRSAEARNILGQIRAAEDLYYLEYTTRTTNMSALNLVIPIGCSQTDTYFSYSITSGVSGYTYTATRCTSGGKPPSAIQSYLLNMTASGILDGTPGYI